MNDSDFTLPGRIEFTCEGKGFPCRWGGWIHWLTPDDPRLPSGPFLCDGCLTGKNMGPVYVVMETLPNGTIREAGHWSLSAAGAEEDIRDIHRSQRYRGEPLRSLYVKVEKPPGTAAN